MIARVTWKGRAGQEKAFERIHVYFFPLIESHGNFKEGRDFLRWTEHIFKYTRIMETGTPSMKLTWHIKNIPKQSISARPFLSKKMFQSHSICFAMTESGARDPRDKNRSRTYFKTSLRID